MKIRSDLVAQKEKLLNAHRHLCQNRNALSDTDLSIGSNKDNPLSRIDPQATVTTRLCPKHTAACRVLSRGIAACYLITMTPSTSQAAK